MKKTLIALMFAAIATPLFAADGPTSRPMPSAPAGRWATWTAGASASPRTSTDHGKYPEVKSAEEARAAFEPVYIAHLPMTDAWGRPYAVESDANGFTVVSAGADGKFDKQSWSTGGDAEVVR